VVEQAALRVVPVETTTAVVVAVVVQDLAVVVVVDPVLLRATNSGNPE